MTVADTWSTKGLPTAAVRDAWSQKMSELHLAWSLSFPRHERFDAAVRYRRLDGLTVSDFRGGRYVGRRGTAMAGGPQIGVLINLSGRLVCRHGDKELLVGPDELVLWDSEMAHGFDAVEPHRELSLLLPRDRVPQGLAAAAARSLGAVSVAAGSGLAAIAADQLRAITRELDNLSDAGLAIASQSFFDTLDSALAPPDERARRLPHRPGGAAAAGPPVHRGPPGRPRPVRLLRRRGARHLRTHPARGLRRNGHHRRALHPRAAPAGLLPGAGPGAWRHDGHRRGVPLGLQRRGALQPGLQTSVRRHAEQRRRTSPPGRGGGVTTHPACCAPSPASATPPTAH